MKLEIVTPERRLDEVEATEILAPGELGEFGVLPGHEPYLVGLGTGVLSYHHQGQRQVVMVSGGVCEVLEDRITVLAEYAQPAGEISLDEARRRVDELSKELEALAAGDSQTEELHGHLQRWQARASAASIR